MYGWPISSDPLREATHVLRAILTSESCSRRSPSLACSTSLRPISTAAGRRVDLVVLNEAPPLLTHEVIRAGLVIVCRDDDERVDFETRATARYLDTAYLRRVQHHYLRERAEARRAHPA